MKTVYHCFPEGKIKALTLSYDDGKESDTRLVQLLNQYNVKSTFNINSGLFGNDGGLGIRLNEEEARELYENHEVSIHTFNHPTLTRCPKEQVVLQILEDRKNLERIFKRTIRGMAYPNVDGYNEEIKKVLPLIGVDYARITGSSMNFFMPKDYYQWQFTCDHRHDLIKLGKEFASLNKTQYFYMMSVYGHTIDLEKENCWTLFEDFLKLVSGKNNVWYATNIEIVDYLRALDNLRFSVDLSFVENPFSNTCWISVDNQVFMLPGGTRTFLNIPKKG